MPQRFGYQAMEWFTNKISKMGSSAGACKSFSRISCSEPVPLALLLMNRQWRQTCVCPGGCCESEITVPTTSLKTTDLQLLRLLTSTSSDIILGRLDGVVVRNTSYRVRLLGVPISALHLISCVNLGHVTYPLWAWFLICKMERIKNPPHRVTVRTEWDSTCTVLSTGPSTQRELKNGSYYHLSLMNVYKMLQKNAVTTRCCYSHPKTVQYFNKVKHFPHTLYLSIFTFCFVFQSRVHFHHIFLGPDTSCHIHT